MPYNTKEKAKAAHRRYYLANREKILARNKEHDAKFREQKREYGKKHYQDNIEKKRRYKIEHQESIRQRMKDYHMKNKEKARGKKIKRCYGITEEFFLEMLGNQGCSCAICGQSGWGGRWGTPHIDHNHKTGVVRGLLCHSCNLAVGFVFENIEIAEALVTYLTKHKEYGTSKNNRDSKIKNLIQGENQDV